MDRGTRVVHCKKESFDVYIGRPSKWGNPFTHLKDLKTQAKYICESRKAAVEAYREWITNGDGKHLLRDLHELKGKTLGCWCHPRLCHGHVLVELVELVELLTVEEKKAEAERKKSTEWTLFKDEQ